MKKFLLFLLLPIMSFACGIESNDLVIHIIDPEDNRDHRISIGGIEYPLSLYLSNDKYFCIMEEKIYEVIFNMQNLEGDDLKLRIAYLSGMCDAFDLFLKNQ